MTAARQSLIKIHWSVRLALTGQAAKETPYIRIRILIMFECTSHQQTSLPSYVPTEQWFLLHHSATHTKQYVHDN
jgi:hypothetical protein